MLLIKTSPITPKQRGKRERKIKKNYRSFFFFFLKIKTKNKTSLTNTKLFSHFKYFYPNFLYKFFIIKTLFFPVVVYQICEKSAPLKEFMWGKNIFNQIFFFLNTNYVYPGFKLFDVQTLLSTRYTLLNQLLPLKLVPINLPISYIFNETNISMTYSKSSGSTSWKKKLHKKKKLVYIELPSTKLKTFPHYTYCVFGENKNLFVNKIVEGGWGFTHKLKKLISVRGVAKNPVDHPNGGRTKAKQPELSPWGWVAKYNK